MFVYFEECLHSLIMKVIAVTIKAHIIIKSKVRYWKETTTEVRSECLDPK